MNKNEFIEMAVVDLKGDFDNVVVPERYFMQLNNNTAKRESVRFAFTGIEATREEFNAAADRMRGKPDWKDAPEWAQWLAQDADGKWYFYGSEIPPGTDQDSFIIDDQINTRAAKGKCLGDWRNTLEKRPEQSKPLEADRFGIMPPVNKNECCSISTPAKPWFEAGELPPVGTACEVYNHEFGKHADWEKCTILFMGKFKCIYSSESCHERVGNVDLTGSIEFRPIKTDKEKAIEAASAVLKNPKINTNIDASYHFRIAMDALADAGCLKVPDQK